jgi:predicted negative regulator of RcsB-dependent stress response
LRGYTRHQLKQDQFTEAARETVHWAVEHRQKLIWGGVGALVLLAIVFASLLYRRHQENQATEAFGRAMLTYNAPLGGGEQESSAGPSFGTARERVQAAHAEFEKIVQQYSGTRTGKLAAYFSGITALELGENAAAENHLKVVIDSADSDLAALAKLALASHYRNSNRATDAARLYNELIAKPSRSVAKETAQLELADLFSSTQPAEARRLYEQIKKDNTQSSAAQMAETCLQSLK